jgi:hypothetical protein
MMVKDVMTPDVMCCFEDHDVQEAATLMQEHQIRRLPVLNRDKKLVGIVSLGDLNVERGDEKLEQVSEPPSPNTAQRPTPPTRPEAAHAQPVDPEAQALQEAGLAQPPYDAQLQAAGKDQPGDAQQRLQKVLPEIKDVAQKVGGFKQLAEIAETLDQPKG